MSTAPSSIAASSRAMTPLDTAAASNDNNAARSNDSVGSPRESEATTQRTNKAAHVVRNLDNLNMKQRTGTLLHSPLSVHACQ